jgi:hypothetical protein
LSCGSVDACEATELPTAGPRPAPGNINNAHRANWSKVVVSCPLVRNLRQIAGHGCLISLQSIHIDRWMRQLYRSPVNGQLFNAVPGIHRAGDKARRMRWLGCRLSAVCYIGLVTGSLASGCLACGDCGQTHLSRRTRRILPTFCSKVTITFLIFFTALGGGRQAESATMRCVLRGGS